VNGVLVPGIETMSNTSPYFVPASDTNGNGFFDPGEIWTWANIPLVLTQNPSNILAWGHGIDPLGNPVDYPAVPEEAQQIQVTVVSGNTAVSITANTTTVNAGGMITLTVTEANTGNVALTNPFVNVNPGGYLLNKASPYYVSGDAGIINTLDIGETWTWIIPNVVVNANTVFTAIGHGTDPLGNDITWPPYESERRAVSVTVNQPHTTTQITATPDNLPASGGITTLTITETNDGFVPLNNPTVTVSDGGLFIVVLNGPPTGGDNGNGILDIGETWIWFINGVPVNANTTFTATGDATYGNPPIHVTWPQYPTERDSVTVTLTLVMLPASSNTGMAILIVGLAALMAFFIYRRTRQSAQKS